MRYNTPSVLQTKGLVMRTFFLTLFTLLIFVSCDSKVQNSTPNTPPKLVTPSKHALKSQELTTIMIEFENLIFERFYSELERDKKRIQYTQEMEDSLDEIVLETKKLQQTVPYIKNLNKADAAEFHTLASALEESAKKLKKITAQYKTEEINPTLKQMINICNQCHEKFQ